MEPAKSKSATSPGMIRLALIVLQLACLIWVFREGLGNMLSVWQRGANWYQFLVPAGAAFLAWQRVASMPAGERQGGAVLSVLLLLLMLAGFTVGELGSIYTLIQLSFIGAFAGVILATFGNVAWRVWPIPIAFLLFMIPLPNFFHNRLFRLIETLCATVATAVLRVLRVSVFHVGGVLEVGAVHLSVNVSESVLRWLLPLVCLGIFMVFAVRLTVWRKLVVLFVAAALMPALAVFELIAGGLLAARGSAGVAEMLMAAVNSPVSGLVGAAAVIGLAYGLSDRQWPARLRELRESAAGKLAIIRPLRPVDGVIALLLVGSVVWSAVLTTRTDYLPAHHALADFPNSYAGWRGRPAYVEPAQIRSLRIDDHLARFYAHDDVPDRSLSMWVAYYASQRKGQSVHSPRSCLPGDGWFIVSFGQTRIESHDFLVNRVIIGKGDERHLVYYWFVERGRPMTNEYLAKLSIFWDALTIRRTDGALIRLTTPIPRDGDESPAEAFLQAFVRDSEDLLMRYLPEEDAVLPVAAVQR